MKSKTKLRQLNDKEIQGGKEYETFEDVIKELEDALSTSAEKYIPRACTALKRQYPLMSSEAIRLKILKHPTISRVWMEGTIRNHWPPWMKNEVRVEAGKKGRASQEYTKMLTKSEQISQNDLDRDAEAMPIQSWTQSEYEETHPTIAESPFQAIGEINRSIARLWTALTKQKNMPTRQDNVMKEYIIPARERLKDIANGSSKIERDFLFNWLTWVDMAIKDCRDIFEKADATAYDTRDK